MTQSHTENIFFHRQLKYLNSDHISADSFSITNLPYAYI